MRGACLSPWLVAGFAEKNLLLKRSRDPDTTTRAPFLACSVWQIARASFTAVQTDAHHLPMFEYIPQNETSVTPVGANLEAGHMPI